MYAAHTPAQIMRSRAKTGERGEEKHAKSKMQKLNNK